MADDIIKIDVSQPLVDKSGSGKNRPWARHRNEADILTVAYATYDPDRAARVRGCAPRLLFRQDEGKLKLDTAWFCRVRLCPICQWRRSMKIYGQAVEVIDAANKEAKSKKGYGWIMLTLTVRNVDGCDLKQAISDLNAAWHRLIKLEPWKKVVLGTMKSLEVTHNTDEESKKTGWYGTYHPHLHVMCCVNVTYFKSQDYMTFTQWQALWRQAARLDYNPSIDVHRIDDRNESGDVKAKRVAEMCKYATKPTDYLLPSDFDGMVETIQTLDSALHHKRLVSWSGNLKRIHSALHLDDIEDGDLVHTSEEEATAKAEEHMLLAYSWYKEKRNYYLEINDDGTPYLTRGDVPNAKTKKRATRKDE